MFWKYISNSNFHLTKFFDIPANYFEIWNINSLDQVSVFIQFNKPLFLFALLTYWSESFDLSWTNFLLGCWYQDYTFLELRRFSPFLFFLFFFFFFFFFWCVWNNLLLSKWLFNLHSIVLKRFLWLMDSLLLRQIFLTVRFELC